MIAGLPGTGIGGVFYLVLALCMPLRELWRTVTGRKDAEKRRIMLTQSIITVFMLLAIWAAGWAAGWLFWTLWAHGLVAGAAPTGGNAAVRNLLKLYPVLLTLVMLVVLYLGLRTVRLIIGHRAYRPGQVPAAPVGLSEEAAALWQAVVRDRARSRLRLGQIEEALRFLDHANRVRQRLDWAADPRSLERLEKARYLELARLERQSREHFVRLWAQLQLGQPSEIEKVA